MRKKPNTFWNEMFFLVRSYLAHPNVKWTSVWRALIENVEHLLMIFFLFFFNVHA